MRFMTIWRPGPNAVNYSPAMQALIEEMTKAGVLGPTGGWDPHGPCTMLRNDGTTVTVTDGPYAEAKELIGGFAILEVKSKEEAIAYGKRFVTIAGEGSSEMRELYDGPAPT